MKRQRRAALLVVDVINPFDFAGASRLLGAAERIAEAVLRARAAFDRAGLPVVYCNDNFGKWRSDARANLAACMAANRPGARFVEALAPRSTDYFVLKPRHSAFLATPLELLLRSLRIRRVVIVGLAGDSCVHSTAVDAHSRDFEVFVVGDATASETPTRNRRAIAQLEDRAAIRAVSSRGVARILRA